ncbi:proline-rich protein 36 [Molothrus aeneus]|uniref:proline-rich protein 36 n=1 Tax=Molothrus aeneus TaxID=84833 RepID=UPI0034592E54
MPLKPPLSCPSAPVCHPYSLSFAPQPPASRCHPPAAPATLSISVCHPLCPLPAPPSAPSLCHPQAPTVPLELPPACHAGKDPKKTLSNLFFVLHSLSCPSPCPSLLCPSLCPALLCPVLLSVLPFCLSCILFCPALSCSSLSSSSVCPAFLSVQPSSILPFSLSCILCPAFCPAPLSVLSVLPCSVLHFVPPFSLSCILSCPALSSILCPVLLCPAFSVLHSVLPCSVLLISVQLFCLSCLSLCPALLCPALFPVLHSLSCILCPAFCPAPLSVQALSLSFSLSCPLCSLAGVFWGCCLASCAAGGGSVPRELSRALWSCSLAQGPFLTPPPFTRSWPLSAASQPLLPASSL